jgi:hypothetical protein
MQEIFSALVVFILLIAGTGVGFFGKPYLPEEHRKHETMQLIQLVMTMLVTFAALVLGCSRHRRKAASIRSAITSARSPRS